MGKIRYILTVISNDYDIILYDFFDEAALMNFIMDMEEKKDKPLTMLLVYRKDGNTKKTKWL